MALSFVELAHTFLLALEKGHCHPRYLVLQKRISPKWQSTRLMELLSLTKRAHQPLRTKSAFTIIFSPPDFNLCPFQPPADPLPAFRDFVTNEKQRLTQKRQALVKSEMDKRMAELKKFSQSFKVSHETLHEVAF